MSLHPEITSGPLLRPAMVGHSNVRLVQVSSIAIKGGDTRMLWRGVLRRRRLREVLPADYGLYGSYLIGRQVNWTAILLLRH